jgi:hypothetical protein
MQNTDFNSHRASRQAGVEWDSSKARNYIQFKFKIAVAGDPTSPTDRQIILLARIDFTTVRRRHQGG